MITFEHFSFRYASQTESTLKDIHLTIQEGQKVLILGQSGSGKSTLVHCINGLIPHSFKGETTGRCWVDGQDISTTSIFRLSQSVGTVLQDSDAQFVALSVEDDVAFALENQALSKEEMMPKVLKATQRVGMQDFLTQVPYQLSGGQKQKVALAGVLNETAKVLLFDEPLASLDPKSGEAAIELMDELSSSHTIIIVEHRFEDVLFKHIDRVIVMHEGQVVYDGEVDELLKSNVLHHYGLREPLYVSALKQAHVDITQIPQLAWVNFKDLQIYAPQLKAYVKAYPEVNHACPELLVQVDKVSFAYEKKPVLSDISFKLYKGERIAIVGQNGAGKSTLAKLLTGVLKPNQGTIHLLNKTTLQLSIKEIAQTIGYVMQNPNHMLVKHMIKEEVSLALQLRNMSLVDIEARVEEALKICGLYAMRNWPTSALSYGQRKRVTVAIVLALKPEVLILDEPTAGQDFAHYTEIMDFLDSLNQNLGITFIFITHDLHLALEYTQRALVFAHGNLLADQSTAEVLSNPKLLEEASLKQTSLYHLAKATHIPSEDLIHAFIGHRRSQ